jgi:glutathione synthase/RimK-type ligase-like ATP-grasp enzyme
LADEDKRRGFAMNTEEAKKVIKILLMDDGGFSVGQYQVARFIDAFPQFKELAIEMFEAEFAEELKTFDAYILRKDIF